MSQVNEACADHGDGVGTGQEFPLQINPMKLSRVIAMAALATPLLFAAKPAWAMNQWQTVGTNTSGNTYYVKPLEFSGRYRRFLGTASHVDAVFKQIADCSLWRVRPLNSRFWQAVKPGSIGEVEIKMICQ